MNATPEEQAHKYRVNLPLFVAFLAIDIELGDIDYHSIDEAREYIEQHYPPLPDGTPTRPDWLGALAEGNPDYLDELLPVVRAELFTAIKEYQA